jgi:hypothetical protein
MEFITDRYEHKYKHRAGISWYRFILQVKCGKVSLRGYVKKEEEEEYEEKEKEKEEEVCASCQQSGSP